MFLVSTVQKDKDILYLGQTVKWPNENYFQNVSVFNTKLMVFGHILARGNWVVGSWKKGETE